MNSNTGHNVNWLKITDIIGSILALVLTIGYVFFISYYGRSCPQIITLPFDDSTLRIIIVAFYGIAALVCFPVSVSKKIREKISSRLSLRATIWLAGIGIFLVVDFAFMLTLSGITIKTNGFEHFPENYAGCRNIF